MIGVKELKKTYGKGTSSKEEVLHGVSFELPETGFVCILGRSGSGKTSLLNAIGGLDVFDSGEVEVEGSRITHTARREMEKQRNANFGYIFQNYYLLPEHSAAYNVYLGLHSLDLTEREKLKRVEDALRKVDMLRFRKRLVGELSGGQQQRIAIARAIAKSPKVIFADEPTGNLDEESTLNICSLLKKLSKTGLVVMVTHEERLADFFADRIITIESGNIVSDSTGWERGSLVSADKNTVYAGDYREKEFRSEAVDLRVLCAEGAEPADLTVIIEEGRIVIKTDDKRLMMCSKPADPPVVKEGSRPRLDPSVFDAEPPAEEEHSRPPMKKASGSGLGFKMLLAEMRTEASKKKLRNAAAGLFIVLLALMLLIALSDLNTAAKVDPETFITADRHVLEINVSKGKSWDDRTALSVSEYVPRLLKVLDDAQLEFDLIPDTNLRFGFYSNLLPQYGTLFMSLGKYNMVDLRRLDPSALIYGRMPERSDEIVIDRWVIKNCTDDDGIVQNLIPDNEYMLGKKIYMDRKNYYPTIVGICDSGEPSIYIPAAGLLAVGIRGVSAIPYSEFVRITGRTDLEPIAQGETVLIKNNVGELLLKKIGTEMYLDNGGYLFVKGAIELDEQKRYEYSLNSPMIIADEEVDPLLRSTVESVSHFDIWSADKEAVKKTLTEELPRELENRLLVEVKDTYTQEYNAFMSARNARLQTRFIITAAIGLLCIVMLYVIQRFRVRDRIGMIAVYRMLGIPNRDSMGVFIIENVLLTLKFAVPAVFIAWGAVTLLPILGVGGLSIEVPLWAPFAAIGIILLAEVIVAVIAVRRLLRMPPAKLASKYDF